MVKLYTHTHTCTCLHSQDTLSLTLPSQTCQHEHITTPMHSRLPLR
uniref:Uncharacterized protein n=1 Tax=Anguilla anguilla TaxID=7936 RepID=A0A0E9UZL4_ANGAN